MRRVLFCMLVLIASPAAARTLACGGMVAPQLAYPDANGAWHGLEVRLCRTIAAKIGARAVFTPIMRASDVPPPGDGHSVMFLPAGAIAAGYSPGPVIYDDNQALMVPAGSKVLDAAGLADAEICVRPGSAAAFRLRAYFAAHGIALRIFGFQEAGEMHDAYSDGRCDAITGRRSELISLRASEGRDDVILPDDLGDHFIRAATPAARPGWAARVARIIEEKHP